MRIKNRSNIIPTLSLGVILSLSGVTGCGYHAPLSAEEYNPEIHSDHRIDIAEVEPIKELYQIMKDTHEVFTQCGLPYWADSGTALGAIRNGGIIPWDDDNDTAMSSQDVERLLILRPIFTNLGYFIEKVFFGYRIVKDGTSAGVDIFLMNETNGKFYYDRGDWGSRQDTDSLKTGSIYITREELFPLKVVDFGPVKVTVPNNPNPYLSAMFRGWNEIAFTYGHLGQRKFKIDLAKYSNFRQPAPLDPDTLQPIDIRDSIQNRVSPTLVCPKLDNTRRIPFPTFYDGI